MATLPASDSILESSCAHTLTVLVLDAPSDVVTPSSLARVLLVIWLTEIEAVNARPLSPEASAPATVRLRIAELACAASTWMLVPATRLTPFAVANTSLSMSLYEMAAPMAVCSLLLTTWPATESIVEESAALMETVLPVTVLNEALAPGADTSALTAFWVWLTTTEPAPENLSALAAPRARPRMWVCDSALMFTTLSAPVASSCAFSTLAVTVLPIRF